jgi:hypothetical protein
MQARMSQTSVIKCFNNKGFDAKEYFGLWPSALNETKVRLCW